MTGAMVLVGHAAPESSAEYLNYSHPYVNKFG
jgi:hypothetical protein